MLKDTEKMMLTLMLSEGQAGTVTEGDVRQAVEWAEDIRSDGDEMDRGFLDLVLRGSLSLDVRGEEPLFSLTKKGEEQARALLKNISH